MGFGDFDFDLDLSCAATLPFTRYRDPQLAALEQDRILARTWQLVGHTEQVRLPTPRSLSRPRCLDTGGTHRPLR